MRLSSFLLAAAIATTLPVAVSARARPRRTAAQSLQQSRIVSVRPRADADASVVELLGDRPLSFTTLRLDGPPRVVLDFPDARFDFVVAELSIEDGTVRRVGAAPAGLRTARVIIELAGDAEFDVRSSGNRLDVRVPRLQPLRLLVAGAPRPLPVLAPPPVIPARPPAPIDVAPPPLVAAAPPPAETRRPEPATALAMQAPPLVEAASPSAHDAARAEFDPEAAMAAAHAALDPRIEADAADDEAAAKPEAEPARPQAVAKAEEPKVAEEPKAEEPKAEPAPEVVAKSEEEPKAEERKPEPVAIAKVEPRPAPHLLSEVDPQGRASAVAAEAVEGAHASAAAERPKLPTVALVGRSALPPSRATPPPPAVAKPAPPTPPKSKPPKLVLARPRRSAIHGIGFRPSAGGVVIVRSDHPVEYTVAVSDHALVLRLPGASIASANNRLPLDTSVFGGAVLRLVPRVVPGAVELRVELRERVDFDIKQSGAVLTVTFAPTG